MLDNMDSSSSCKSSTGDQMLSTTSSTARDSLRDSSRSSNPEEGKLHDRAKPKKKSSKKGKKIKKDKDRRRSNSNATNLPTTPPPSSSSLLMSNTIANRTSLREAGAPDVSPIRETDITSSDIESVWAETHLLDEEDEVWYASPSRSSSLLVPSEDLLTTPRVESRVSVGPPAGKLMNGRPHNTTFTTQDTFPLSDGSFGSFRPPQDELPSPNFQTFEHIPSTDTEQPAVHDSKPVSNSGKANRGRSTNRMLKMIATVAVTTLIGILIGVGISVAVHFAIHKDGKGDKAIWQSMNTPTMSPSLAPTSISTEILLAAVELSGADVLADRESPQLKAVAWMSTFDEVYTQGLDHQDFEQRYAFVVMYFSFQGESWLNQEQWLTPLLHECEWSTGIFCEASVSGSLVLGFDATRNNLQGTIPFEIGLLRSCEFYRIGKNSIEGVIPDSIGDMTSLGSVVMSNNMLTGPIPTSLANVRDLKLLDLSNNQLNSSIPVELCNLQFLRTATLKNNRLTGSLVESISNLTSIVTLDLRNNQLSGTVPVSLDSIESLDTLRLDYNRLTGRLPPITSSITLMKSIGLSHNFLSGNIELHPDYKLSTDSADLRLQYIDLSYNLLSGPISSLLGILPSFRHLNLNGNGFVGTFPSSIGWDNIEFLAAANNALTGTVPVGHPTLTHLDFSGNLLSDGIPEELCDYPNLEFLILSDNPLQSTIPSCLAAVTRLRALELASCNLVGPIPKTIVGQLTDLSILDASSNSLSGTIPLEIGSLTNLEHLKLHKNSLTGTIPSQMSNMVNLLTLDINKNYLTGTFPSEFEAFVKLETLQVQGNSGLRGEIPAGLCDVSTLEVLAKDVGCSLICECCSDTEIFCGL